MAAIVRWTLGNPTPEGFHALLCSIYSWRHFYPHFRRVVCHNYTNADYIRHLKYRGDVELLNQNDEYDAHKDSYLWKLGPNTAAWKLCPPRLDLNAHEVFCDNDLVLMSRLPSLDRFLNSTTPMICDGLQRNLGNFDKLVSEEVKLNTGLLGLPPQFDLAARMLICQKEAGMTGWESMFDEQGLITYIFTRDNKYSLIPLDEVYNCAIEFRLSPGVHFCGLNSGNVKPWLSFKKHMLKVL